MAPNGSNPSGQFTESGDSLSVAESSFGSNHASRMRSLLGDLAKVLDIQMRYWGMDAQGGEKSIMVSTGMLRLARDVSHGEGSSRYRQPWEGGWIEIHSFCAGFYHFQKRGIVFSRAARRIFCPVVGGVADPRHHRASNAGSPPDEVLRSLPPFLSWILDYERRVAGLVHHDYRLRCWKKLGSSRFGPHPNELHEWISNFLLDPTKTPRFLAGRNPKNRRPSFSGASFLSSRNPGPTQSIPSRKSSA